MKLLLIANEFPPLTTTGVFRALYLCRGLVARGHDVTVLTNFNRDVRVTDPWLESFIPPQVKVIRIMSGGEKLAVRLKRATKEWLVWVTGRRILALAHALRKPGAEVVAPEEPPKVVAPEPPKPAEIPTSTCHLELTPLMEKMLKVGKRVARSCDLVFVTVPSWEPLIVADMIARQTGKPLVVDYRDLWACNPVAPGNDQEQRVEHGILERASQVITVTKSCERIYRERFPHIAEKVAIITNGFDRAMLPEPKTLPGALRLIYAGALYGGRDLGCVVAGLTSFSQEKLRLDFYGSGHIVPSGSPEPPDLVERHGFVPRQTALEKLAETDVAIVVSALGDKSALPLKTYDALSLNKTILFIGDEDAEVVDFIRQYGQVFTLPYDCAPEQVEALMRDLIARKAEGTLSQPTDPAFGQLESMTHVDEFLEVFAKALK